MSRFLFFLTGLIVACAVLSHYRAARAHNSLVCNSSRIDYLSSGEVVERHVCVEVAGR